MIEVAIQCPFKLCIVIVNNSKIERNSVPFTSAIIIEGKASEVCFKARKA